MKPRDMGAKDRLDFVFALAKRQGGDEESLAHWARYLCVLTSGFVETSLRAVLMAHVETRSQASVSNFVESRIEGITNLNEEKVYQLLVAFQPEWGDKFRKGRTEAQKDALDSVVANRNQIAHGRSVGVTLARVSDYYREIARVLQFIESECVK